MENIIERLNAREAITGSVRRKKWYLIKYSNNERLSYDIVAPFSSTEIFIFASKFEPVQQTYT